MTDVPGYLIRPFEESDRPAVDALGQFVVDWWNADCPTLHRVAAAQESDEVVAHLQIADRSFPQPSRRPGECHLRLTVAPGHRGRGLGSALYVQAEAFARQQKATRITTAYFEKPEQARIQEFLTHRGFVPYERYYPSHLDLADFDPERFAAAVARTENQGIRLFTYSEVEDTRENRRKLYAVEQSGHSVQPFREVGEYVPPPFEKWEEERVKWNPETVYLAAAGGEWVGVITSLEWGFTGVHPEWQSRGIATALKVRSLSDAKGQGIKRIETENHEDNQAMLAINRKLGFVFDSPEVNCVRMLD